MDTVKVGDKVKINYRGTFLDGTEFDSSVDSDPLEFAAGGQEMIPGVSKGVIGMKAGEKKSVTIPPEEAYGEHRDDFKMDVPRDKLPEDVRVGAVLGVNTPEGLFQAVLVEMRETECVLDGNHPLAGKTLIFDLELVSIGE